LEVDELPRNVQVSSQVRHNIAKAVKEAVCNAIKHAHASEISLSVTFQKPELTICVKDNGIGFKVEDYEAARNGLRSIEHRMDNVGGNCRIESRPEQGTSIRMQLNLN
jgi:signal transduction histidine kinase